MVGPVLWQQLDHLMLKLFVQLRMLQYCSNILLTKKLLKRKLKICLLFFRPTMPVTLNAGFRMPSW